MIKKSFKTNLVDLFYITDSKRVKAENNEMYELADQLSATQDYLELAIADEFNIEWNN